MNIIEHVRKHSGAVKIIVTAGFLAGLAISSYSSAYASYTGKTDTKYNAYALKQAQSTVYYAKEPQRVLMWNNGQAGGDIVGKRDGTVDNNGDYWAVDNTDVTAGYISDASKQSVGNYDSNISIPIQTTGKVHRVQITGDAPLGQAGQAGNDTGYRGSFVHPYWTLADGTVKRALTEGKKYVLFCYAKGKGRWMIGDEQNGENIRNAASGVHEYTLSENSWTKVEQVFTAGTESEYTAFIQYSHLPSVGDYCDVTDVFIAEIQETQSRDVLNQVGSFADGSSQLGFQGWSNTPDKCGVGYDSSDADAKTTDIIPVEGRVYYPVIKRYAIDVNAIINNNYVADGTQSSTNFVPANLTLKINGVAVANNRHGDIFTSAPAGSTYSLTINSVDAGYRFKGYSSNDYGITSHTDTDEDVNSRLIYFKTNAKKNSYDPVETPTTTESGTLNSTIAFNLMLSTYYKITWNLDGGSGTYEDTYETTDNDYVVTPPTKGGYAFAGWTGTGLSGTTRNLVIPKGSTGDRAYTAHWGFEVGCEEWTYDFNGNPYKRIYSYPKTIVAESGKQLSASAWGTGAHDPSWYSVKDYETITVSGPNQVVRKIVSNYRWHVYSQTFSGEYIPASFTLERLYFDRNGNQIARRNDRFTNAARALASDRRDPYFDGCDGIKLRVSNVSGTRGLHFRQLIDVGVTKAMNTNSPDGYTSRDTDNPGLSLIWDDGRTDFKLFMLRDKVTWNSQLHDFTVEKRSDNSDNISYDFYYVKEPGQNERKMNFSEINNRWFERGTTIRSANEYQARRGYVLDKSYENIWYEGGGQGTQNSAPVHDGTFVIDAPTSIIGSSIMQDAYAVVFKANGGFGEMDNVLINNVSPSRNLGTCTFTGPGGKSFKGWATSRERANAGTVDYADNATMPVDRTNLCGYKTLYAVWG